MVRQTGSSMLLPASWLLLFSFRCACFGPHDRILTSNQPFQLRSQFGFVQYGKWSNCTLFFRILPFCCAILDVSKPSTSGFKHDVPDSLLIRLNTSAIRFLFSSPLAIVVILSLSPLSSFFAIIAIL